MDDLFRPPLGPWSGVSPRLATGRRVVGIAVVGGLWLVVGATLVVSSAVEDGWPLWPVAVPTIIAALAAAWIWSWAGRNQRSWGYLEAESELLVTRGIMFRRLVAIPYGRMQYVDVTAGPLARRLGIATVTLHTASTETAAEIPGVPEAEARRLRDRLTEVGESHGAGL